MRRFFEEAYRAGFTPWQDAGRLGAAQLDRLLARDLDERATPPGRALDIGCGRGEHALTLAALGWRVCGVDYVESAIEQARAREGSESVEFVLGDATDLPAVVEGPFDLVLDVGTMHGFTQPERLAYGRGVTAVSAADATMLMLVFAPGAPAPLPPGMTLADIEEALPAWQVDDVDPVDTTGMPFPDVPVQWYRLRRTVDD